MRFIISPDREKVVRLAASFFMENVASEVVTEPQLTVAAYSPQQPQANQASTGETLHDQIIDALENRMERAGFTKRERAVGRLAMAGLTTRQMVAVLSHYGSPMSRGTIDRLLISAQRKTGSLNRAGLAAYLLGFGAKEARKEIIMQAAAEINPPEPMPISAAFEEVKPTVTNEEIKVVHSICERMMDYYGLMPRERQIAWLAMQGLSNAQIGQKMLLAESTVKEHMSNLFNLLGTRKRSQITAILLGSIFKSR